MYHNTSPEERGIRRPNPNNTTAAPPDGITYGQSPASGPAPTTAGHHTHDIINKLDPRVDSTHDRQPMPQTNNGKIPEGTYGPHSSRLANTLDPRVDSDLDSKRAGAGMGAGGGLGGHAQPAAGMGTGMGMAGGMHHSAGAGAGYAPQQQQHGQVAEGTYGPHHSRMANAADPRVDSDRDRHGHLGAAAGGTHGNGGGGIMGGGPAPPPGTQYQGGAGTHHAGMAGHSGAGAGGVSAPHAAGPHKSELLNKLDPRVDSKTGTYKDTAGTGGRY